MRYLFVGEKRSDLAIKMGVTWRDGRLAAKQLFDALKANNIEPLDHEYTNWFEYGNKTKIKSFDGIVVGMGNKVCLALKKAKVNHIPIFHPATRGAIRKKELYFAHIKERLNLK